MNRYFDLFDAKREELHWPRRNALQFVVELKRIPNPYSDHDKYGRSEYRVHLSFQSKKNSEAYSSTHEYSGSRQQGQINQRASAVGGERGGGGGQGANVEMKRRSQSMPRSELNLNK